VQGIRIFVDPVDFAHGGIAPVVLRVLIPMVADNGTAKHKRGVQSKLVFTARERRKQDQQFLGQVVLEEDLEVC